MANLGTIGGVASDAARGLSRVDMANLAKIKAMMPQHAPAIDAAIAAGDRAAAAAIVRDAKLGVGSPRIYRSADSPPMGQPSTVQVARPAEPRIYRSGESATMGQPQVTQVGNDAPLPRPAPQPRPAPATAGEEIAGDAMDVGRGTDEAIPPLVSEPNELFFDANMDRFRGFYPELAARMDEGDLMAFDEARSLFRQHQAVGWDAPIGGAMDVRPPQAAASPVRYSDSPDAMRVRPPDGRPVDFTYPRADQLPATWQDTLDAAGQYAGAAGRGVGRGLSWLDNAIEHPLRGAGAGAGALWRNKNKAALATAAGLYAMGFNPFQQQDEEDPRAAMAGEQRPLPGDDAESLLSQDDGSPVDMAAPPADLLAGVGEPNIQVPFPEMDGGVTPSMPDIVSREMLAESLPGEVMGRVSPPQGHSLTADGFDREVYRRAAELGMDPDDVRETLLGNSDVGNIGWDELQANRRKLYALKQMGRAQDLEERKNRVRQYGIARGMGMDRATYDAYSQMTPEQKARWIANRNPAMARSARFGRNGWEWSETPVHAPLDEGGWRRDVAQIQADAEIQRANSILERMGFEHTERMQGMRDSRDAAMKQYEIQAETNRIMRENQGITARAAMREAEARWEAAQAQKESARAQVIAAEKPGEIAQKGTLAQELTQEQRMAAGRKAAQEAKDTVYTPAYMPGRSQSHYRQLVKEEIVAALNEAGLPPEEQAIILAEHGFVG